MAGSRELKVLEAFWKNVIRVIDADLFYVVLFNKVSVRLDFPLVMQKIENKWQPSIQEPQPYQPDEFLPDVIFRDHEAILTRFDVENHAFSKRVIASVRQRPLSWLGVPLIVGNNAIGVVVVENYQREGSYDANTRRLLRMMADRVASDIAQTRMVENLRAVNRVGQTLTSSVRLRETEVLERIFRQASQLMNTDNMYIALLDVKDQRLHFPLARESGEAQSWPSRQIVFDDRSKGGLTEIVLRTRKPLLISDVETYCKSNNITLPIPPIPKSWLGVPMVIGDEVLGIIALQNDDIRDLYGPDDQEVLQTMAGQAAVAIENARLYEHLEERVRGRTRRLSALFRVGQSLNSAIRLDQDGMLALIVEQIDSLMDARNMYIALYDSFLKNLSFPIAREKGVVDKAVEGKERSVDLEDITKGGFTEIVIRTQKPLLVTNVKAWCDENDMALPISPIPKSWIGVPIMLEDKILGIISLRSHEAENAYNREDLEILQAMAGQAAVALENVRLYGELSDFNENLERRVQERTAQLTALQDIGVKLASQLDLQEVLEAIVQHAATLTNADFFTLFPYDPDKGVFEPGIRRGKVTVAPSIPGNSGITARAVKAQEPIFVEDTKKHPDTKRIFIQDKEIRAFASVPLLSRGRSVGVLYVNYFEPHAFSQEEQEIIRLLVNQAAVAIENARLYEKLEERVKERTRELEMANDELRRARDREIWAALGEVTAGLIHKMSNSLGPFPYWIERVERVIDAEDAITRKRLSDIRESAASALVYTNNLAKILELREIEKEQADIGVLLNEAVRQVIPEPDTINLALKLFVPLELPTLYVNVPLVNEVFQNIIRNAMEAMPDGGELIICAQIVDEGVEIQIADTGCGIPEDKQDSIFTPGFSSKKEGKGIGLWFSKTVVKRHRGTIAFSSREARGTTFTIFLPKSQQISEREGSDLEVSHV